MLNSWETSGRRFPGMLLTGYYLYVRDKKSYLHGLPNLPLEISKISSNTENELIFNNESPMSRYHL